MTEATLVDVKAGEVRAAALAAGISEVQHHDCSMCGYMTKYVVADGRLYFDPGCDCTGDRGLEPRSWEAAAEWINMQSSPEVRNRIATAFGLPAAKESQ